MSPILPPLAFLPYHALDLKTAWNGERRSWSDEAIGLLVEELERARDRDWPNLLFRAGRVAVAVATALFLLFGTGLLDWLGGVDTRFRFLSLAARSLVHTSAPSKDLVVVTLGQETVQALGDHGRRFRATHAALLRGLAEYRPKAVVFDVYFPPSKGEEERAGTEALAEAIRSARARGRGSVFDPGPRPHASGNDRARSRHAG